MHQVEAVAIGEDQVDEHHIWLQRQGELRAVCEVAPLADDQQVWLAGKSQPKAEPSRRVMVSAKVSGARGKARFWAYTNEG